MRQFCLSLLVMSGLAVGLSAGVGEFPKDSIDRLSRVGAWGSIALLYGGAALTIQRMVELATINLFSHISFLESFQDGYAPALVGGTVAAPLTCTAFSFYREPAWYFFFVLYSGRRASPTIARIAFDHYVNHLSMLKDINRELGVLLKNAEDAASGPLQPRDAKTITSELVRLVEQAVKNGEAYVGDVRHRLDELGFSPEKGEAVEVQVLERFGYLVDQIRAEESVASPVNLEIDLVALDRLVRDLIAYWNAYLTGLVDIIDYQVSLCKKVYYMEQFISGIMKRPLASHSDKPSAPAPNPNNPNNPINPKPPFNPISGRIA